MMSLPQTPLILRTEKSGQPVPCRPGWITHVAPDGRFLFTPLSTAKPLPTRQPQTGAI